MGLMSGRNVLVTGATDGIGLETARQLLEMDGKVWIVGRNPQKTKQVAELLSLTGKGSIGWFVADLSRIQSIQKLAQEITQTVDHLDVMINNAGAVFTSRHISADGLEMTYAFNHVSYFLLTDLLLELLRAGKQPRIVNVSSSAHYGGHIDFDDMYSYKMYNPMRAYSNSKLMNVLFTYEFVRRMGNTGIAANVLHPGFVATNFGKSNGGIMKPIFALTHLLAMNANEGAKTSVYLASSPEVEGVTGRYFDKCRAVDSSRESYDRAISERLWTETVELIGANKSSQ